MPTLLFADLAVRPMLRQGRYRVPTWSLEEEGFKVTVANGCREKTVATLYGQEIGFAILEKVDRIDLTSPPKGGVLERVLTYGGKPYRYELSGRLSLQIWKP